jgi:hypothetical protein
MQATKWRRISLPCRHSPAAELSADLQLAAKDQLAHDPPGPVRASGDQSAWERGRWSRDRSNDSGVPISGVFSGAAAPIRTAIKFPPGLLISGVGFQLLVNHKLPDGSKRPVVSRPRALARPKGPTKRAYNDTSCPSKPAPP